MDPRIMEKINLLKTKEDEEILAKQQAEADAAKKRKEYIDSKVPDAEKWVDDFLFGEIAKLSLQIANNYNRSINLDDKDGIPIESKVIAIQNKKIQGVTIKKTYRPEDYDPNDESHRTMMPAYWSHYVVWSA